MTALAVANEQLPSHRFDPDQPAALLRRIVLLERKQTYKEIADNMRRLGCEVSPETVRRWTLNLQDIPPHKMPPLYFALKQCLALWSCLLEQCGLIVIPKPAPIVGASPARLLGHLSLSQARILDIFTELQEKKEITQDDVRRMREIAEQLKQHADRAVAWAEQKLKEQGEKKP